MAPLSAVGSLLLPSVFIDRPWRIGTDAGGNRKIGQIREYGSVPVRQLLVRSGLFHLKYFIIIRQICTFCQIVIVLDHQSGQLFRIQLVKGRDRLSKPHGPETV